MTSGIVFAGDAPALSRRDAESFCSRLIQKRHAELKVERAQEVEARSLTLGTQTLRWHDSTYGKAGKKGWPLWISLHGGGEVPQVVNDEQWKKQGTLYQPAVGIYVTPRAPTDTWNLWHEPHMDALFERLIEDMIAFREVDPNRIYILGYSAGGNGVYHLAPRMADRFAAAATMAGYPSGAPQLSLRNLPFAILVGAHDTTFDRVKEAESWTKNFTELRRNDPKGYPSYFRIYPDCGHWMKGKDVEAIPWMAEFQRNPWPKKIVWVQDSTVRGRFYWLEIPLSDAKSGVEIRATVTGQTISITGAPGSTITLWLSDDLLDLDRPIVVQLNGSSIHDGRVPRTKDAIQASLSARLDPPACATALLKLTL